MIHLARFSKTFLLIFIWVVAACSTQAATIFVDSSATGLGNGTSWTDAYPDLQPALQAAVSGDEIWVANGTYYPGPQGAPSSTFSLKSGVALYGGFEGFGGAEETMVSQRDWFANICIISGDLDSSGGVNTDDAYNVMTALNTDTTAIVDGFTIKGGNAVGPLNGNRGGAIQAFTGSVAVYNCLIEGNRGVFGAAIRASRNLILENVDFRNNICSNRGGAVYLTGTGPSRVINCTFYRNEAPNNLGGAFFAQGSNTTFSHCTFAENVGSQGSAIYNFSATNIITNCIFWDNTGFDIRGTNPTIDHCIVEGGFAAGTNILNVDPLFADTLLRLRACSPAVDAGDSLTGITQDIRGEIRPFDGDGDLIARWDLGSHESQVQGIVPSPQTLLGQLPACLGVEGLPYTVGNDLTPLNTYSWVLSGGGTIDTGSDSSTVVIDWGPATGSFELYLTETVASTGCLLEDTFVINIDTVPTVDIAPIGNDSICDEDSLLLSATGQGAGFQWLLNGTPISGATNSGFYAKDAGIHNVVLTDGNGCFDTAAVNIDLFVHPLPVISFTTSVPPAICQGDSITITAPSGVSMQWYENGAARPNDTLDNITVNTAGLYNMIQVDVNGCSDSADIGQTVIVHPLPIVGVSPSGSDTLCPGDSLALTGSAAGATSFQWTRDGVPISGAISNPYFASVSGFYNVQLTDSNTCVDTASAGHRILIGDFVNPDPQCKDTTVFLNAGGSITLDGTFVDNGSTDNCLVDSFGLSTATFVCADTGTNTITVTVFDGVGNTATCSSQITVEDSTRPIALCQDTILYLDNGGNLVLTPADVDAGSSDNCGIASMQVNLVNFTCSDTGTHIVTLTVIDVSGNVNQCTAQVTIADSTPPIPGCQDTTVILDGSGNASITAASIENGSIDNCGIDTFFVDQDTFTCADVPSLNVTLTIRDVSGNTATCTRLVTVRDTVAPIAICNDTIIYIDNSGQALLSSSDVDGGSTDNCGIVASSLSQSLFTCLDTGVNVITVTYADADTNISTCTSQITILDTVAPVAICSDTTFYLDSFGVAIVDPFVFGINSTDNCTFFDTIYVDVGPFTCADTGTHPVNLFLSDISGRADSCSGNITIADSTGPFTICRDTSLILGPAGSLTVQPSDIDLGTVDNCTLDTTFVDQDSFFCADAGVQLVTLTAIDIFGNLSSCISQVTVVDSVFPIAVCKDSTLYLDSAGTASIQAIDIDDGSTDNCFIDTIFLDIYSFSCLDTGANAVTLEVQDQFGNATTCTSNITVRDTIKPTAICNNTTVYLDSNGVYILNYNEIGLSSYDNCLIFNTSLSQGQIMCADTGANNITVMVTDPSGNQDSCTAVVTALDTLAPFTNCPDTTLYLDANGTLSISPGTVGGQTMDNCQIDSSFLDQSQFSCGDVGTQLVTAVFIDASGNSAVCSLNLTILDSVAPVSQCEDTTLFLDGSGMASISIIQINDSSYDACGIDTVYLDRSLFDCNDLGTSSATLTVVDVNGNMDSCTAQVTVFDTISPIAECKPDTVYFDSLGGAQVSALNFDNGTSDICGIDTIVLNPPTFDCTNLGNTTVFLSAFDIAGNFDSCNTTLWLFDTIAPVAVCDTTIAQLTATGGVTLDPVLVAANSYDNCIFDSVWIDVDSFNCSDIGFNTITLFLLDPSGNQSSCQEIVQVLDSNGTADVQVNLGADTTACNGDSIVLSPGPGFLSYIWSNQTNDSSLTVDTAGIYYVTVISQEGCNGSDTIEITTHTVDDPNIRTESGELVICNNDQLILMADTGFSSYLWSTGSIFTFINITTGGTYTLIVSDSTGCTLASDITINYVPTPAPNVEIIPNGPLDICEGEEEILDAGSGYFAYLWNTGNTTQFQTVTMAGAYSVQVWNGFGCHSTSAPVVANLLGNPLPLLSQSGDSLICTTPAASFQWNLNGNPISGATDSIFVPLASGNYTVTLTFDNGCDRSSLSLPIIVSIPEALTALLNLELYPNPTKGMVHIKSEKPLNGRVNITLVDGIGQILLKHEEKGFEDEMELDLSEYPNGIYFIELEYKGQKASLRVALMN